jgi:hypothetical protein
MDPLVQSIHPCGGVSIFGHGAAQPFACARQPGTGKALVGRSCGEPLSEGPSQRTPRCRLGLAQLEVRASPSGDRATGNRSK